MLFVSLRTISWMQASLRVWKCTKENADRVVEISESVIFYSGAKTSPVIELVVLNDIALDTPVSEALFGSSRSLQRLSVTDGTSGPHILVICPKPALIWGPAMRGC
ncbi:hypothetical protein HGRIS_001381 [Hohenbuehelia grisea]|uniref:Uncharacterized protein n=1 Tax=Hohenbuehelia grisea TaxID=104357 RepID=A0ABR3JPB8_9AGAR